MLPCSVASNGAPRNLVPRERFIGGRQTDRLRVSTPELAELAENGLRLEGKRGSREPGHHLRPRALRLHALRLRLGQRAPAAAAIANAGPGALHVRAAQNDVDASVVRGAHYTAGKDRYRLGF